MISPEDICGKAARKYRAVLQAHVRGEFDSLFPMLIRADRKLGTNLGEAARAVETLRGKSKEIRGYGYAVEWEERRSRQFGKNPFPKRISIPTLTDFLKLIGKNAEFQRFEKRVAQLRSQFPELEPWLEKNVTRIINSEPDWEGLIEVLYYFREHPSPGVFARELPLTVDSKFIENHQTELCPLLEFVLPESAINLDEVEFDRRFGLRPFEAMIRMRFLDPDLQQAAGVHQSEFGLPVDQLRDVNWPIRRVVIVENARCLLTLPRMPSGTLGLFGHGYRVSNFRRLSWLSHCEIYYWGDLDVQGFEILSDLRQIYSHTKSVMMGIDTLKYLQETLPGGEGTVSRRRAAPILENSELDAWKWCRENNGRIEQERVPISLVTDVFERIRT